MNFRIMIAFLLSLGFMQAKDINVVVFLTQSDKFDSAFTIVSGLQKTLQNDEKADIELVMGGNSVDIFASNTKRSIEVKEKIKNLLLMPHVRIVACQGAMRRIGMDESLLIEGVQKVKAAPREVVLRQLEGYAFLQE